MELHMIQRAKQLRTKFWSALGPVLIGILIWLATTQSQAVGTNNTNKSDANKLTSAAVASQPVPPSMTSQERRQAAELAALEDLSIALKPAYRAHWQDAAIDEYGLSKLLIVEALPIGKLKPGNLMLLPRPELLPMQASWFEPLSNMLTEKGWRLLSLGLPSLPPNPTPDTPILSKEKASARDQSDASAQNSNPTIQTGEPPAVEPLSSADWLEMASRRGQALLNHSAQYLPAKQHVLVAVGESAIVASALATELNAQVSALVIINLQNLADTEQVQLDDQLIRKGPILEILVNPSSIQRRQARRRLPVA